MRVLIATTAGSGHFAPLVPFATAVHEAGHAVRVAAPASFAVAVRRAGFDHVPLADGPTDQLGAVFARLPSLSMEAANAVIIGEVFCGIDARAALPAMQAAADEWRPDLILRETAEFASYVVAEHNGIPHAQVAISLAALEDFMQPLVDQPLRTLGAERGWAGLAAAPHLTRQSRIPRGMRPSLAGGGGWAGIGEVASASSTACRSNCGTPTADDAGQARQLQQCEA